MHPQLSHQLATARVAELRHQAEHEALSHAALRARRRQAGHPAPRLYVAGRRVLSFLNARSA
jgi:hypothetical protein